MPTLTLPSNFFSLEWCCIKVCRGYKITTTLSETIHLYTYIHIHIGTSKP